MNAEQITETHADGMTRESVNGAVVNEHREVWAADEIPFDVALEAVNRGGVDSRIKATKALMHSLYNDLVDLNPKVKDHGKYLNIEASAHGYRPHQSCEFSVYFHEGISLLDAGSLAQIQSALAAYDPEKAKAQKIEKLRAELTALESEASK